MILTPSHPVPPTTPPLINQCLLYSSVHRHQYTDISSQTSVCTYPRMNVGQDYDVNVSKRQIGYLVIINTTTSTVADLFGVDRYRICWIQYKWYHYQNSKENVPRWWQQRPKWRRRRRRRRARCVHRAILLFSLFLSCFEPKPLLSVDVLCLQLDMIYKLLLVLATLVLYCTSKVATYCRSI